MTRIAILGGGISGLAAAYELEIARREGAPIDWQLYEATDRLGGIVQTTRRATPAGDFVLEGGPDAWVTEKPWAHELATELGLERELMSSNDTARRTYILIDGTLQPMPDRMRLMVPEDLETLEGSALFSAEARAAFASERTRAEELRSGAPQTDEPVASFVGRHFGPEVLAKVAVPLLSGVFGGDVHKLSVRAVMPAFAAMEREHGSLIAALEARAKARAGTPEQPIFTTLRGGLESLIDRLAAALPGERLHRESPIAEVLRSPAGWLLRAEPKGCTGWAHFEPFERIFCATNLDTTRALLRPIDPEAAALLPREASSAILAVLCWPAETAGAFSIPRGFGFLAPQNTGLQNAGPQNQSLPPSAPETTPDAAVGGETGHDPQLLACTFVDQKFAGRAPQGARILRAFFGGRSADALAWQSDEAVASVAFRQLERILQPQPFSLPAPETRLTVVRRWPRSLPQYEVGHLERMAELDRRLAGLGGLTLLGNGFRGVGLPDLIHSARRAARSAIEADRAAISR